MANGFGSLFIGKSGLQSSQNALNTTANNLANINTTGYVREQVRFADKHYLTIKDPTLTVNMHQSGLGVSIGDVVHARDIFLDKAFRQETGRAAFYQSCYDANSQVTDLFQELYGMEFKESLKDLYNSFAEMSKYPGDSTYQNLVMQKSQLFMSRCNGLYGGLKQLQTTLNDQMKTDIARVNEIGEQIYTLNQKISKIESCGVETAMTDRDIRDALIDELATLVRVDVKEDANGVTLVDVENSSFVTEDLFFKIDCIIDDGTGYVTPIWPEQSDLDRKVYTEVFRMNVDIDTDANNDIGKIKADMIARGSTLGRYTDLLPENYREVQDCVVMESQAQLENLFHGLVTQINDCFAPNIIVEEDIEGDGWTIPAGAKILDVANCVVGIDGKIPPRELFSRMGTERYTELEVDGQTYYLYNEEDPTDPNTMYIIGNVEINKDLMKQITLMPAYAPNGAMDTVDYSVAEKLTHIWDDKTLLLNPNDPYPSTYTNYYDKIIGHLGTYGNTYYSAAESLTETAASIENQRSQLTGVSSDEELTKMIKYQAAYNAASRYITVVDQMTELLVTGLK